MLDFIRSMSLEKLVIDNEICGMAYRLISGIAQREEPIAIDKFEGFTAEMQFLSLPHTKQWYRKEHTYPKISDRDTYEAWVAQGKKSMEARAAEEVEKILRSNPPALVDKNVQKELEGIILSYAKANGVAALPEIK